MTDEMLFKIFCGYKHTKLHNKLPKCVVIVSAGPGQLDKFMEANTDMVEASGHVLESTVLTTYTS